MLEKLTIEYTENSYGRHTAVTHTNEAGEPVASRFSGWISELQIQAKIHHFRAHDRNRRPE